MTPYEEEINRNAEIWETKALLRDVYFQMYAKLAQWIDTSVPGKIIEIGSGIGNFGEFRSDVVLTDQSVHPWIDLTCSGYQLPFRDRTLSHIVMVDVFHHLRAIHHGGWRSRRRARAIHQPDVGRRVRDFSR
jgi:hypothetical protein